MRCPNCGAAVEQDDSFCQECGSQLFQISKRRNKLIVILPIVCLSFILSAGISIYMLFFRGKSESKEQYRTADTTEELYEEYEEEIPEITGQGRSDWEDSDTYGTDTENLYGQDAVEDWGKARADTSEYIFEDSDSRYLTESDINGLSLQEINYAKNEIYARHGRKFNSQELRDYFNSKSWYNGIYEPDDFDKNYSDSMLNDYEKKNAEFLSETEHVMDSSGYLP